MQVGIAYSDPVQQVWLRIEVAEDSNVEQAIIKSGILRQFPDIDLTEQAVGVFGKLVKLDAALNPGDRVEIYRGIIADPATVPRRQMADDDDD
ncbi:MAG: RnfH family protein [Hydrogenophilales bacterium]|nr:RnfH family protein [Hydrogenophilales bacterium]